MEETRKREKSGEGGIENLTYVWRVEEANKLQWIHLSRSFHGHIDHDTIMIFVVIELRLSEARLNIQTQKIRLEKNLSGISYRRLNSY